MKKLREPALVLALLGLAGAARAQGAEPADAGPLRALVAEVRLLRQAVERRSAVEARVQLLVARLALQDQRLARLHSEARQVDSELASADAERTRLRAALAEMQQVLDTEAGSVRRTALEGELRVLGPQLQRIEDRFRDLVIRKTQTAEGLESERARYEELQAALDQLERELERSGR